MLSANHFMQPNAKTRWFFEVERNLASLIIVSNTVLSNFAAADDWPLAFMLNVNAIFKFCFFLY